MDAVAVSMTNGMTVRPLRFREVLADAAAFGFFQGLMPLIGYFAGATFAEYMETFGHWVALGLLGFIGGKMIWDSWKEEKTQSCCTVKMTFRLIFLQAVATSIDALAVGVSLAALRISIWLPVLMIALTTFCCSFTAVLIGKKCGDLFRSKSGFLGGGILILIGLKIFLDGILG